MALALLVPVLTAQDIELPELEIITPENAERLVELAHWQSVDDNGIATATFSPDGQTPALAVNDGTIQLLDAQTLSLQQVLEGADFLGTELRFSADGSRLLLSNWVGDNRLWDVESGEILGGYTPQPGNNYWNVSDPNLQTLAILRSTNSADFTISVLDFDTGQERISLSPVETLPRPQLNPGGSLLILADSTDNMTVWDTTIGELVYTYPPQLDTPSNDCCLVSLEGFGFSPDGKMMWGSWRDFVINRDHDLNRSIIQFWDTVTGESLFTLEGGGGHHSMVFDPTSSVVATLGENDHLMPNVWIWDLATGQMIGDDIIGGGVLEFSPDGQLFVIGLSNTSSVRIFETASSKYSLVRFEIPEFIPEFSPDGRLLLLTDPEVRLFGVPVGPHSAIPD
jgi:WD40 repeat protein